MFWESVEQANQRLSGSVVMYGNDPVRFSGIASKKTVVRNLRTGEDVAVSLSDKAFEDFRKLPPLGLVNLTGDVAVFTRTPTRSQTHGHADGNISVRTTKGRERFSRILASNLAGYIEMIDNDYPTFREAIDNVSRDQPIAFSRKYCLVMSRAGFKTLRRGEKTIGVVASDGTVLLPKTTMCFREDFLNTVPDTAVMEI